MDFIGYRPWGPIDSTVTMHEIWGLRGQLNAGVPAGLLTTPNCLPKLPGHPGNAYSYDGFQVMYAIVEGSNDAELIENAVKQAEYLCRNGVRFVVGIAPELAVCQKAVRNAVDIPVYMSPLCEMGWVAVALGASQKYAVITQEKSRITKELVDVLGVDPKYYEKALIIDPEGYETFSSLKDHPTHYNAGKLRDEAVALCVKAKEDHPELGAILLDSPDIMPFAADIQAAVDLPVYDTVTLVHYCVKFALKEHFYGYF